MISLLPDDASLTFRAAIELCPYGWRHLVERCFQAALVGGVPFMIRAVTNENAHLRVNITFDQSRWKERSQEETKRLDNSILLIVRSERESFFTCEVCGGYGVRWVLNKKLFVCCYGCAEGMFKSTLKDASIIDDAPWRRGVSVATSSPDYY